MLVHSDIKPDGGKKGRRKLEIRPVAEVHVPRRTAARDEPFIFENTGIVISKGQRFFQG